MTRPDGGEAVPRDPGLQPERTALSWRRTLLALIVADLLIWRAWVNPADHGHGSELVRLWGLGMAAATAAAVTIVFCSCVIHRTRVLHSKNSAPTTALTRTATIAVVALAGSVITAVLLS